ncbi:MAG TPA: hypothetical protein VLB44_09465, partial [Kofleriaceae bacterium]|nr:hypothetical protein [Kofleriaceae bacterium]
MLVCSRIPALASCSARECRQQTRRSQFLPARRRIGAPARDPLRGRRRHADGACTCTCTCTCTGSHLMPSLPERIDPAQLARMGSLAIKARV